MNIVSLYYFVELAKDLHVTHTANRLFISQQNLSNHIARLEKHFGVALFSRKPKFKLTYAGEVVLSYAKEMIGKEQDIQNMLKDVRHEAVGNIRIGGSPIRISQAMVSTLPEFTKSYPRVTVSIIDKTSEYLERLVLNGELDLAIVMDVDDNPLLEITPLINDLVFVCVTDDLLKQYYPNTFQQIKEKSVHGCNVKDLIRLPFSTLHNRLGKEINNCFEEEQLKPTIYTTSTLTRIATTLALHGNSAAFTTKVGITATFCDIPDNLNVFPLLYKNEFMVKQVSLIHMKNQYLPSYGQHMKQLLIDYYAAVEEKRLAKIV